MRHRIAFAIALTLTSAACADLLGLGAPPDLRNAEGPDGAIDAEPQEDGAGDGRVSDVAPLEAEACDACTIADGATDAHEPDTMSDHSAASADGPGSADFDATDATPSDLDAMNAVDAADATIGNFDAADGDINAAEAEGFSVGVPTSCLDVHNQNPTAPTGVYTITVDGGSFSVYCQMDVDNGGWTAFFADRAGSPYAQYEFDTTIVGPMDSCDDPRTRCLRHLPSTVGVDNDFAVMCGSDAVRFRLDDLGIQFFQAGVESGWLGLTEQVAIAGQPALSDVEAVWTGTGQTSNPGWIIASIDILSVSSMRNAVFASSYNYVTAMTASFDYCNGNSDDLSDPPLEWLFYR